MACLECVCDGTFHGTNARSRPSSCPRLVFLLLMRWHAVVGVSYVCHVCGQPITLMYTLMEFPVLNAEVCAVSLHLVRSSLSL